MDTSEISLSQKLRAKRGQAGLNTLAVGKAIYDFAADGGAVSTITPKKTFTLPKNAVIVACIVNSTTAVTSAGSSTMSIGTSAGSSAASLLAATGKASYSLNALINGAATFAAPVKMSAQGDITVTIAVAAQTAGVVEVEVFYYVANA
jgi:hypothetical protein